LTLGPLAQASGKVRLLGMDTSKSSTFRLPVCFNARPIKIMLATSPNRTIVVATVKANVVYIPDINRFFLEDPTILTGETVDS
jgi:hypothetical protein